MFFHTKNIFFHGWTYSIVSIPQTSVIKNGISFEFWPWRREFSNFIFSYIVGYNRWSWLRKIFDNKRGSLTIKDKIAQDTFSSSSSTKILFFSESPSASKVEHFFNCKGSFEMLQSSRCHLVNLKFLSWMIYFYTIATHSVTGCNVFWRSWNAFDPITSSFASLPSSEKQLIEMLVSFI